MRNQFLKKSLSTTAAIIGTATLLGTALTTASATQPHNTLETKFEFRVDRTVADDPRADEATQTRLAEEAHTFCATLAEGKTRFDKKRCRRDVMAQVNRQLAALSDEQRLAETR